MGTMGFFRGQDLKKDLTSRTTVRSFTRATPLGPLVLAAMLLAPQPVGADPIPVRFVEGAMHGFLVLSTFDGTQLASGDLLQVSRGDGEVESRMVFKFSDGVDF